MKIVSGGQTGADRAALDFALERGLPCGGWCPRGRRAEDGAIPLRYPLRETETSHYLERTEANVRDSDATVIFTLGPELSGGSKHTARLARRWQRPYLHIHPQLLDPVGEMVSFLTELGPRLKVLNVAGSRETDGRDGVGRFVLGILKQVWDLLDAEAGNSDGSQFSNGV